MRRLLPLLLTVFFARAPQAEETKLNNFVSILFKQSGPAGAKPFEFSRSRDGWIYISAKADENPELILDSTNRLSLRDSEAMQHVSKGQHTLRVDRGDLQNLEIRAIPELMHSGLGYNPQIKSYGFYDWAFLKRDILPNITTIIVPAALKLAQPEIDQWHAQGKKFVGEVGVDSAAKTADDHWRYWTGFYDQSPYLDGIIIDEFIVNRPVVEWAPLTPERLQRMDREREQYVVYGQAIQKMHEDDRYKTKMLYAYFGGSGKKLNREIIGTNFVRTIIDCGYRVALERYLHEMSSPRGSQEALQTFLDGLADWEAKAPGVTRQMVIAFGLFSMPTGGLNKQPNVDYHVWMDQQMNLVANHPTLAGIAGLNWWTTLLADEETVRFVGKLYRHYAIEGKTNMLTGDPLFLTHIQNADFEHGTENWSLHPAREGTITTKSFPRYGRIEGRFMGLGRPADPEHIGDTFLWMKRDQSGPNTFSQTIKDLQPGRLYSLKMFTCDYQDLIHPKAKTQADAHKFIGSVTVDGVALDSKRSFTEMYASSPEPDIPVWITYHWKIFRAKTDTAKLTVSDWPESTAPNNTFGHEQTFNFVEIQPYHE